MEKLPPGKRATRINFEAVGRAHEAAAAVLRDAGESTVSMLVLAARIIKYHASLAGTPVEITLANVISLIDQIDPVPGASKGDC